MQLNARINHLAKEKHIPAQAVLQNFMLERLLERISLSKYCDKFVFKGGLLIASWVGIDNRTTMDMDATLRDYPLGEKSLEAVLSEMCRIDLHDGVTMVFEHIEPIRADDEYGGYRVAITSRFETIKTPVKIDITTGDAITPKAIRYSYHSNFWEKEFNILAYPIETVLAEKIETILRRSVLNTRSRDFYDIYMLMKMRRDQINKKIFTIALAATTERRNSTHTMRDFENLLAVIQTDAVMRDRWERYCRENYYAGEIPFEDTIESVRILLN